MDHTVLAQSGIRVSRLALGLAFRDQTDESVIEATVARGRHS